MATLEKQSFLGSLTGMEWMEREIEVELLTREGRRYTGGWGEETTRHADGM